MPFKKECIWLLTNILNTILYRIVSSGETPSNIKNIVFVCKGNICRSVFAEYLLKKCTKSTDLSIESCGLDVESRMHPPREAIEMAKKFGLNIENHLSKGWKGCDLENSDMIIVMEYWQYIKLVGLFPHKKKSIKLLRDFAPFPENVLCNINDPYGENEEMFEKCFKKIERSILNIM